MTSFSSCSLILIRFMVVSLLTLIPETSSTRKKHKGKEDHLDALRPRDSLNSGVAKPLFITQLNITN